MRLWIGNMEPGTTDDELKDLVKKYAPELECTEIQRVEGGGTHPAAMLSFTGTTSDQLGNLALRLQGMYWKGRSINCHTLIT
jgi:RNA recognition motif-containing protein